MSEFRAHPRFPSYSVAADGRIFKQKADGSFKERVTSPDRDGYLRFAIVVKGKTFWCGAHWFVCEAWHGPKPTAKHEARHGNGKRADNRPRNLSWGTRKENSADREAHGRTARGERQGLAKLTAANVREIRSTPYKHGVNAMLARKFGVTGPLISYVRSRKVWNHV